MFTANSTRMPTRINTHCTDQLSLTNPRDALHHHKRDKFATDLLTTLRVESRRFSATSAAFNIPHLHLAPPLGEGGDPV